MVERDELAHLRDEENRAEFATRRAQARLAAEERELEHEMTDFEHAEEEAKKEIEGEWRREHQGHEPERPPAWRANRPADA
ncbi:MAG: hypothetical protein ACXVH3_36715 [Solirubrobacteraceae bacterium]